MLVVQIFLFFVPPKQCEACLNLEDLDTCDGEAAEAVASASENVEVALSKAQLCGILTMRPLRLAWPGPGCKGCQRPPQTRQTPKMFGFEHNYYFLGHNYYFLGYYTELLFHYSNNCHYCQFPHYFGHFGHFLGNFYYFGQIWTFSKASKSLWTL